MKENWAVFFDGQCRLCSKSVRWIIRNDRRKRFTFIPLQAVHQQETKRQNGTLDITGDPRDQTDTVLLLLDGKEYVRSGAILRIALRLRFPWPMLGIFFLVPPFIRDAAYMLVARNRKSWFGEEPCCYVP